MRRRAGVTLVELLVAIAILAVATGLSSVALSRTGAPARPDATQQLLTLRRDAIRSGAPITRVVQRGTMSHVVTALADGRVLADSALPLDSSTGMLDDASR